MTSPTRFRATRMRLTLPDEYLAPGVDERLDGICGQNEQVLATEQVGTAKRHAKRSGRLLS